MNTPQGIVSQDELVAFALGQSDPGEAARIGAALAADPALGEVLASVRAHLARYDALPPAPPPPPFVRVAAALEGRRRIARIAAASLAAAAGLAAIFVVSRGPTDVRPVAVLASHAREFGPGDDVAFEEATDVRWLGRSARAFLDLGTRLEDVDDRGARLTQGRAWFEVEPAAASSSASPSPADALPSADAVPPSDAVSSSDASPNGGQPFRIATRFGDVTVRGTEFEVDVRGEELVVAVLSGRVEARGLRVGPGERLVGDLVSRSAEAPGGFARVPRLGLESAPPDRSGAAGSGTGAVLHFVFENPREVPMRLSAHDGAPATLWLSVTAPDGAVTDLPVAATDWLPAGSDELRLAPGERRVVPVRFLRPFTSPGTYRGVALFRPDGLPAVRSGILAIEVPR